MNNLDYLTIKYNELGTQQWTVRYDGPSSQTDRANVIFLNGQGDVYVTGESANEENGYDFLTIKYDNLLGIQRWSDRYNGPGNGDDRAKSLMIDQYGDIFVSGYSLGNGTGFDYVTIKYGCDDMKKWEIRYNSLGNNADQLIDMIYSYANGTIFVTGTSNDAIDNSITTVKYHQVLDTSFYYVHGEKDYWYPQKDVYAFRLSDSSKYLGNLPGNIVDTLVYDSTNFYKYNLVYFTKQSSICNIVDLIDDIENDPKFQRSFPIVTRDTNTYLPVEVYIDTLHHANNNKWVLVLDWLLVKFKLGTTSGQIDTFQNNHNLTKNWEPPSALGLEAYYIFEINDTTVDPITLARQIHEEEYLSGIVLEVQPARAEWRFPNSNGSWICNDPDTYYNDLWHLKNTGQCVGQFPEGYGKSGADIDADLAWNMDYSGAGVRVAVIDEIGFQTNHPDMTNRFVAGWNTVENNNNVGSIPSKTRTAHAQLVSGIIAANECNGWGIAGVAHGSKIIPIVSDLTEPSLIKALHKCYDTELGADIVNMSFGGEALSAAVENAINFCADNGRNGNGIVFVASGGNKNEIDNNHFPSNYDNVIGVIASTPDDTKKVKCNWDTRKVNNWGSNYGPKLDVAAPGTHIISTDYIGNTGINNKLSKKKNYKNYCTKKKLHKDFAYFYKTSASSAIVSGICALILEANADLNRTDVRKALIDGCEKVGGYNYNAYPNDPGRSVEMGYGRVNAKRSIDVALTLGISNVKNTSNITFWVVNPVQDILQVHYSISDLRDEIHMKIYDLLGVEISSITLSSRDSYVEFDLSEYPDGFYIISFINSNNEILQIGRTIKVK